MGLPLNNGYPNEHGDGGSGLGQITNDPQPTNEDLWNWRVNATHASGRLSADIPIAKNHISGLITASGRECPHTDLDDLMEAWYWYQHGRRSGDNYWIGVQVEIADGIEIVSLQRRQDSNAGTVHAESCRVIYNSSPKPWL